MSTGWQPANPPLLGGTIQEFQASTACLGVVGCFYLVWIFCFYFRVFSLCLTHKMGALSMGKLLAEKKIKKIIHLCILSGEEGEL